MNNTTNAVYKIDLSVVENENTRNKDEVYEYLRVGQHYQYLGFGRCSTAYWSLRYDKSKKEVEDELRPLFGREPRSKLGSAYPDDYKFPKGLAMASNIWRKVSTDCENAIKNGNMTPISYKKNMPIEVITIFTNLRSDNLKITDKNGNPTPKNYGFYHNYENDEELFQHLDKSACDIYFQFANKILFKFNLSPNPYKDRRIREMLKKVFSHEYKTCQSKIGLEKLKDTKGEKIVLYLTVEIPVHEFELDENIVMGIDVGVNTPMYCAFNNNPYKRRYIGDGDMLIRHYKRYKEMLKRWQAQAKYNRGGHGRKRKMRCVDNIKLGQANFNEKMAQKIAKEAVEYAEKGHAKYINMEKLEGIYKDNKFLSKIQWPFYLMQQWVEIYAERDGIVVRYIDPAYTSQTCSVCGSVLKEQRDGKSFKCSVASCNSHKMYLDKNGNEWFNADFNAARNIAMSTKFVNESDIMKYGTEEQKKEYLEKKKERKQKKEERKENARSKFIDEETDELDNE